MCVCVCVCACMCVYVCVSVFVFIFGVLELLLLDPFKKDSKKAGGYLES